LKPLRRDTPLYAYYIRNASLRLEGRERHGESRRRHIHTSAAAGYIDTPLRHILPLAIIIAATPAICFSDH